MAISFCSTELHAKIFLWSKAIRHLSSTLDCQRGPDESSREWLQWFSRAPCRGDNQVSSLSAGPSGSVPLLRGCSWYWPVTLAQPCIPPQGPLRGLQIAPSSTAWPLWACVVEMCFCALYSIHPSAFQEIWVGFVVLSRASAAGNTAVNVPVLMCLVCLWHKLPSQLCRYAMVGVTGSQADLETVSSVPPLSRLCLAHSSSEGTLTSLRRKLCLFSTGHLWNLDIVYHWETVTVKYCSVVLCSALSCDQVMQPHEDFKGQGSLSLLPLLPQWHIYVKWDWLHICHHLRRVWVCFQCLLLNGRTPCGLFSFVQKHLRSYCLKCILQWWYL